MNESLKVFIHRMTPKYLVTRLAGSLAGRELGDWTTKGIVKFIEKYRIDMSQAKIEDPAGYKTFNDFFTRELKDGLRPICPGRDKICSPVDGTVAEFGSAAHGRLVAAKGQDYSFRQLLGGGDADAAAFADGRFVCIYLSPSDYHRIHMPADGVLKKMIFVPGKYYSVNPVMVRHIDELFTKNERVVCFFETLAGPMAMVLVGATVVGSISTEWHGTVSPNKLRQVTAWDYGDREIVLRKGETMGRFSLGSTVILMFGRDAVSFADSLAPDRPVKMGEEIGTISDFPGDIPADDAPENGDDGENADSGSAGEDGDSPAGTGTE